MPDVELARRPDIELVRTGSWATMSGSWNPTPEDLAAAVEAQTCPAIAKPVIKLGHLDKRFKPDPDHDGEPAMGYFENLRLADGGHTLLADQVTLPWLHSVQAAAYPSRSVEGNYRHRCSEGHTHRFVLTAVALLGVTPPAVKTIRNLNDLPAMLGVAASDQEVPEGAEHVQVTIMAAEPVEHTGAMIALIPTAEDAERLAVEGGEPVEELHLTLAYLGEAADLGARGKQDVIDHVSTVANGLPRLEAEIFSANAFNPTGADGRDTCLVWGLTGDMLDAVHEMVDDTLHLVDAPIPSQHRPWAAHITAAYTGDLGRIGELATKVGPIAFDRLRLAFGGEFIDIPLMEWPGEEPEPVDDPMLVAAAAGGADSLHDYWTQGAGKKLWVGKPHPWTALFNKLKKHMSTDKAKRTASKWHLEVLGRTPNQRENVKASEEPAEPPTPILPAVEPELVNPEPKEDLVSTELSGIRSRLGLDDTADEQAILSALDALKSKADTPSVAEPTPEMVAASAAAVEKATQAEAEKDELRKEVSILASQMQQVTTELSAAKAAQAATVKASVFDAAVKDGKLKPADREQWEKDYDEAPGAITRVLASIAPGTAVPVMASGHTGPAEPVGNDMAEFEAAMARLDGPISKAV